MYALSTLFTSFTLLYYINKHNDMQIYFRCAVHHVFMPLSFEKNLFVFFFLCDERKISDFIYLMTSFTSRNSCMFTPFFFYYIWITKFILHFNFFHLLHCWSPQKHEHTGTYTWDVALSRLRRYWCTKWATEHLKTTRSLFAYNVLLIIRSSIYAVEMKMYALKLQLVSHLNDLNTNFFHFTRTRISAWTPNKKIEWNTSKQTNFSHSVSLSLTLFLPLVAFTLSRTFVQFITMYLQKHLSHNKSESNKKKGKKYSSEAQQTYTYVNRALNFKSFWHPNLNLHMKIKLFIIGFGKHKWISNDIVWSA